MAVLVIHCIAIDRAGLGPEDGVDDSARTTTSCPKVENVDLTLMAEFTTGSPERWWPNTSFLHDLRRDNETK